MPVDDKEKDKTPTTTGGGTGPFNYAKHSFNADQFMTCINLRYRLPADINEKEGTMFSGTEKFRDENLFFSGVYQVVKIDSRIDNGQFLQTLTCVRMNNQTGEGLPVELVNSARKGNKVVTSSDSNNGKKPKGIRTRHTRVNIKTKVDEEINEVIKKTKKKTNLRGFRR